MHNALRSLLSPAYKCAHFSAACSCMRWQPEVGHVPRGFCGADGELSEVKAVLVFAEPGDPHKGEKHDGLDSALYHSRRCYENGVDLFHRNVRLILSLCFPSASFGEQLRKAWLVDSVLCSASHEGAPVPSSVANTCIRNYLRRQLALMPQALVIALGKKAQGRLAANGIPFIGAHAAAPPGCNRREALPSWRAVAKEVATRCRG